MRTKNHTLKWSVDQKSGFTIVELIIVIIVIGILTAVLGMGINGLQAQSRDTEREEDIASIARQLEEVYASSRLGKPAYPDTSQAMDTTNTFYDTDPSIFHTPGASSSSLVVATNANASTSAVQPQPTIDQYVYQPLTTNDSLCETGNTCVKYNLYYRLEDTNTVIKIKSQRQQ